MFIIMPSVYCSEPSQPGGVTSGQRPGPALFEKSTCTPLERISIPLIDVVIGQRPMSRGELRIVARARLTMSGATGPAGTGPGVGSEPAGTLEVAKARVAENGPTVAASEARTCQ